jgi:excisionase family DNA binding protein
MKQIPLKNAERRHMKNRIEESRDSENPSELGTKAEPLPRLAFSMKETAEILGISYSSVHRLTRRGLLKSSAAFRHKLIPKSEIERFLASTLTS